MDLGTFMSCDDPEAVIKELSSQELTDLHREARLTIGTLTRQLTEVRDMATFLYAEITRRRGL